MLVGTATPGHVTELAGIHRIAKDGLLMLPGEPTELEGSPTRPDYLVTRDIRFCAGADPQLERAKEILAERIQASRDVGSLVPTSE